MMIKKATYEELEQKVALLEKKILSFEQNKEVLKESEKKYKTLLDFAPYPVATFTLMEKRIARSNEAMLRISLALPNYPDLGELLDYISLEIKRLLDTQGALVILLDDERKEFFFPGAAYDDDATKKRIKEIRLPIDSLASGNVIKTGKSIIANDAFKDSKLYRKRDEEFGYSFDNYVLVPVKSSDRIIGVLAAYNKTEGLFEQADSELLEMIAGTVGLSIENARFADELKKSHKELTSLDRAKSKAINHLSHELKTPVAIFSGTLNILSKKLKSLPDDTWKRSMDRAQRNIDRIKQLQGEINDIILDKDVETKNFLLFFVNQCADLLEDTIENESEKINFIDRIRTRINKIFEIKNNTPEKILLNDFVKDCFEELSPRFHHRHLTIRQALDSTFPISMPVEPLKKVINGLIKNAVENTPDHGKIEIIVSKPDSGIMIQVKDYGIGIIKDHQRRIFEGFFTTQETGVYSSKASFDFNAGGRGADLLRMKIFSERYNFKIHVISNRCQFIPRETDLCPGNIKECTFCTDNSDCFQSGGSVFTVNFPMTLLKLYDV